MDRQSYLWRGILLTAKSNRLKRTYKVRTRENFRVLVMTGEYTKSFPAVWGQESKMDDQYFTVKDIAERLLFREETIRQEIRDGHLHAIKIRGDYRISRTNLQDYLKRMATAPVKHEEDEEEVLLAG